MKSSYWPLRLPEAKVLITKYPDVFDEIVVESSVPIDNTNSESVVSDIALFRLVKPEFRKRAERVIQEHLNHRVAFREVKREDFLSVFTVWFKIKHK